MSFLELAGVHVSYGNIEAVRGINISVDAGQIVTLIGGNGAGKTTTLKTISGCCARPAERSRSRVSGSTACARTSSSSAE